MKLDMLKNAAVAAVVAAACSYGVNKVDVGDVTRALRTGEESTNLVITASKQLNKIQFNEQVPLVHLVDTNGNFYLPIGSESSDATNKLQYIMMIRDRYYDSGSGVYKNTIAVSSNIFECVNGGFYEVK